jgi:hypothetical protein
LWSSLFFGRSKKPTLLSEETTFKYAPGMTEASLYANAFGEEAGERRRGQRPSRKQLLSSVGQGALRSVSTMDETTSYDPSRSKMPSIVEIGHDLARIRLNL